MRYSIDTEFIEMPPRRLEGTLIHGSIQLISIGIVSQDGRKLHEVSSDFYPEDANPWVREHVLSILPPPDVMPRRRIEDIRARILDFVGTDKHPRFWAYYADYDWCSFAWIFGAMIQLPKGFPMYCLDLKQAMHHLALPRDYLPKDPDLVHDALSDAQWVHDSLAILEPVAAQKGIRL